MNPNLIAVENKIVRVLSIQPECFITHPAELAALNSCRPMSLKNLPYIMGGGMCLRLGGRQVEFRQ